MNGGSTARRVWTALDRIARSGMVVGAALMLQPWWRDGLRWGFWVTALTTVLHIVTSHRPEILRPDSEATAVDAASG